jgi:hypothetical protein
VTLREVIEAAAADLDAVEASTTGDGTTTWSRGAEPFAAMRGSDGAAEFALDPAVAAAAVRTPDTTPSPRGPGWVLFQPVVLDPHGVDRARAWFASAHRRTGRR